MNVKYKQTLVLAFLLSSKALFAQQADNDSKIYWEDTSAHCHYQRTTLWCYRWLKGYVILKNNDVISGYIKIWGNGKDFITKTGDSDNSVFKSWKDIKLIRVAIPCILGDTLEYRNIGRFPLHINYLWTVVGRKGNVVVYSTPAQMNGLFYYGFELKLFSNNSEIKIASLASIFFGYNEHKKLLKFINKRYKQHFTGADFKDLKAIIDYILDKENEKTGGS
jgi:hypothetical protein